LWGVDKMITLWWLSFGYFMEKHEFRNMFTNTNSFIEYVKAGDAWVISGIFMCGFIDFFMLVCFIGIGN